MKLKLEANLKCSKGLAITSAILLTSLAGMAGYGVYKHFTGTLKEQGKQEANMEVIKHAGEVAEQVVKEQNQEILEEVKNRKKIEKALRSDDPKEKARAAFESLRRKKH